ncbi:MAG: Hpt domain-containing protein [Gammaproteobacteria bacterium]|nr:Hpt domain-containing protein [Gammaproteobacteria bacterium]
MVKENEKESPIDVADPFSRQLVVQYLGRRKADVDRLRQALVAGDYDLIRVTGHNMSGSGAAYGFGQVSEVGAALERAAKAGDTAGIDGLIDRLNSLLTSIRLT